MDKTFAQWLQDQLQAHNMSQAELARRSGLTGAMISLLASGKREPGLDTIKGIARALKLPVEIVYRAAGLLPPKADESVTSEELQHLVSQLDERDQEMIIEMARTMIRQRQPRPNPETLSLQIR